VVAVAANLTDARKHTMSFVLYHLLVAQITGVNGDRLEIGKWQNSTPHRIKTPEPITVVLTCCKADCQSQWETPIFGPSQPGNPLTDFDKV